MGKKRQTGDEIMRFQVPRGTEQKQAEEEEERPERKTDTEQGAGDRGWRGVWERCSD